MLQLRYYQRDAVDAVIEHVKKRLSPAVIELATGAGKSVIVSELARFFVGVAPFKHVLCLAPSKELIEQNHERYTKGYGYPASMYCASAGEKCLKNAVIFASPDSVIKQLDQISMLGIVAVIIDEAHGITPTLRKIVEGIQAKNDKVRVIGMTATPYRMGTGYIYASDHTEAYPVTYDESQAKDPFFSRLIYKIRGGELVKQNYLSPVKIGEDAEHYDTSQLEKDRFGKFSAKSVQQAFDGNTKTERITNKILAQSIGRMGVVIFASTINHAEEILGYLPQEQATIITGKLPKKVRERRIEAFKQREIKYLVNVDVLTTGFDAPHVDVVAILRATESASLFQQMIGRGLRLHPNKTDCLILDYAENIDRHGLQDDIFTPNIKAAKDKSECPEIEVVCPKCGILSLFKKRQDDAFAGLRHNRAGNFLVPGSEVVSRWQDGEPVEFEGKELTMQILDPSTMDDFGEFKTKEIPVPAHYSRRCTNLEAYTSGGQPIPCDHRYSFKICPHCSAENDVAARQCIDCGARLVDPNKKLSEVAGFAGVGSPFPVGEEMRLSCIGAIYEPFLSKQGARFLRVTYKTTNGNIITITHGTDWVIKQLSRINGTHSTNLSPDLKECSKWDKFPVFVTVKPYRDSEKRLRFIVRKLESLK